MATIPDFLSPTKAVNQSTANKSKAPTRQVKVTASSGVTIYDIYDYSKKDLKGHSKGKYKKGATFYIEGEYISNHKTVSWYKTDGSMVNSGKYGFTVRWVKVYTGNSTKRYVIYQIIKGAANPSDREIITYLGDTSITKAVSDVVNKSSQSAANASDDSQNAIDDSSVGANNETPVEGIFSESTGYTPDIDSITLFDKTWNNSSSGAEFFDIRSVLGVFGLPYQFLPVADPRLYNTTDDKVYNDQNYGSDYGDTRGVGAKYAEFIIEQMPILFLAPGKPAFMGKYNKDEKANILENLIKQAGNIIDSIGLDELLENTGKYYTFEYDVVEYYKYVNPMCRIAAAYMNVANYYLDGVPLQSVDWMKYTTSKLSGLFGNTSNANGILDFISIPFYIESETQISDSFGNSVTDSTLASTVNSVSDMARELQFILGNVGTAAEIEQLVGDADINSNAENLQNTIDRLMGSGNNFLGNIANHLVSVATGGKMVFPKIWSGSDFSRSYNITMKFRSPDMDNLSLYFNCVVPTLHLVGFVAPHMLTNDPNSYGNPFLVRGIYKGFFNVDMGIITSMDINRGDESRWNANGVPTVIDVSFTLVDLYEVMSITKTDSTSFKYDTLNNTTQMDYIANFCGINIYKPEIGRTISMWFVNNFANRARDFVSLNVWGNIQQSVSKAITNIFITGDR